MTLIIAHRSGWMVADRRTSFGTELAPIQNSKIIKCYNFLLGIAGEAGLQHHFEDFIYSEGPHSIASAVSKFLLEKKFDCQVLIVTRERHLQFVQANGSFYGLQPEQEWWSIGSGRDVGNAWLKATAQWKKSDVEQADAVDAITYAATLDSRVGDGIQVESMSV